jgi:hypothetical protein
VNIKGLVITLVLMDLMGCSTTLSSQHENIPSTVNTPSLAAPSPAPEIEETNLTSPEKQRTIERGSQRTQDVDIVPPPIISKKTVDCVLALVADSECAGIIITHDD